MSRLEVSRLSFVLSSFIDAPFVAVIVCIMDSSSYISLFGMLLAYPDQQPSKKSTHKTCSNPICVAELDLNLMLLMATLWPEYYWWWRWFVDISPTLTSYDIIKARSPQRFSKLTSSTRSILHRRRRIQTMFSSSSCCLIPSTGSFIPRH
jgi:hypothetical protein